MGKCRRIKDEVDIDITRIPLCRECGTHRTGHVGRRCALCRGVVYTFMLPKHLQHLPRGHRDRVAEEQRIMDEHQLLLQSRARAGGEGASEIEAVGEAMAATP